MIITLSDFSPDAKNEAGAPDRTPITLLSGDQLIALLIENDIGVTTRKLALIELDESSLFPSSSEGPEQLDSVLTGTIPPPASTYAGTKALSMWPMPGGRTAWKDALDSMLKYIAETAPTIPDAVQWVIERYDKVSSPKVARGYFTSVLRPLDLIETQGEQVALTATGAAYLEDPTTTSLLAIARQNVAGFDELLEALSSGPMSTEALLELLRTQLGVSWQTDAQVRFRLLWLENLGKVQEEHGIWTLGPNGAKLALRISARCDDREEVS